MVKLECNSEMAWWVNFSRSLKPTFDEQRKKDDDFFGLQRRWILICKDVLSFYDAKLITNIDDWYIEFKSDEKMTLFLLTYG
jgi:hypothetical protein